MCGITGWFSTHPLTDVANAKLPRMVNALSHRGPDGQGTLIKTHAALGHSRLAIIDLDLGKQPMSYHEQLHIVFNGEIYNYRELMHDLKGRGHQFRTHSDTEVILAMYAEYGLDAFSQLRGMFALAIWDEAQQRAILVRDTIGIKPLFYQFDTDDSLLFASEAKAILAYHGNKASLDIPSLHLLMNFRYLPGNLSLFSGIQQLQPGTILMWKPDGSYNTRQYQYQGSNTGLSSLELLDDAVKTHLTADVGVSAYLSGGIDSAAITAIASRHLSKPFQTYTLDIGDDPNELENARRSAEILNVDNQSMPIPESEVDMHQLIWHLEVPKVNALQGYQLAAMTSAHTKIALSGLGGDELFLGYNAHRLMWQAQTTARYLPGLITKNLSSFGLAINESLEQTAWSERSRALRMLGTLNDWPRVYGLLRNIWDIPFMRNKIYGPRMLDEQPLNAFDYMQSLWPEAETPVAAMTQFEWRHKMVNDLLWQEDRCSMANGLEVRVPYLDTRLANHVQSYNPQTLMPGGKLKYYMRTILAQRLPEEILRRKKSGFQVNASVFFNTQLASLADRYLDPEMIVRYGLFNPDFIRRVRTLKPVKKYRWHFFMLYLMLATHIWLSLFEDTPQDGTMPP